MTVTLRLSPEKQAVLQQRASAAGIDLSSFLLRVIEENLDDQTGFPTDELPFDQWNAEFKAWIAAHQSRNPQLDDSREGIYE